MEQKRDDIVRLWQLVCFDDDIKSFEAFYYLLYDPLVKFCMMYISVREEAEEIVSEIFVKCWMNRGNLQQIERPDTYLFVAVKNQSLNYLKKYSSIRLVQVDDSDEIQLVDTNNPQIQLEKKELHFFLDQSINTLPQQCRIIFKLIKEDGLKYKEVAEILNISPRTVQTQLFRAMDKLRVCLVTHPASPYRTKIGTDILLNIVLMLVSTEIFF